MSSGKKTPTQEPSSKKKRPASTPENCSGVSNTDTPIATSHQNNDIGAAVREALLSLYAPQPAQIFASPPLGAQSNPDEGAHDRSTLQIDEGQPDLHWDTRVSYSTGTRTHRGCAEDLHPGAA
ncbi:uncharacterized protein LOC124274140 [Haliotis rubra]|uniref:uncharacterized protein LOC124272060 n=1 Tax=Haliotis rubra TaxID=36100 RepID=UPI001EE6013D|nr:uncharacterized protein LOC124272060 [Haliotis rubra]XP_046565425.1 uncharacterized protein LOC124274140 [Haliotis rubra]